jgi:hypothetical protein
MKMEMNLHQIEKGLIIIEEGFHQVEIDKLGIERGLQD